METPHGASDEVPMFPPWLDLPPGYLVQDWMQWQRGKIVASRLRQDPNLVLAARQRLEDRKSQLYRPHLEWLDLLEHASIEQICELLESPSDEGQRLRSSSPFHGSPFITPEENEDVRQRAYAGGS
ncbi:hypothetical protein [Prosthecobacter sp.]|uniref:hypothetical protein n=1 Tax=Prosthecobacter sp. TaxID=1965333 RepID=UPI003782DD53